MALNSSVKRKPRRNVNRRNVWLLILTTILIIGSIFMFTPPNERINQGLDIRGGLSVVLTAHTNDGSPITPEDMEASRSIIESRVNALGANSGQRPNSRTDPRSFRYGTGVEHHRPYRFIGVRPVRQFH